MALGKKAVGGAARGRWPDVRVAALPSAEALFRAAAQGGEVALARELALPREQLIGIIGAMGLDPSRRVRRWKDEQRIRDYLIETIVARVQRNRSFLGGEVGGDSPE
ncbi:hypothetical protein [uncultured Thiodictyon sp.]|uniref:hypothetical protein n=1 Tax=uncultured Thiodictyon sp. TaxID=1846217 RepID=UPI0025EB6C2F|nr:hypothetical protein [uncultured Thiodictyon sp.]